MKVTFEKSPYGDEGTTYNNSLDLMNHFILQLQSFRSPRKTKEESDHLEADIRGYQEILDTGVVSNADNFLKIKQDGRRGIGQLFKDNEAVIQHMKDTGIWKYEN